MERTSYFSKVYSHPDKLLIEHLKGVWRIASSFAPSFFKRDEHELLKVITLLHDIGKSTPFFQEYLLVDEAKSKELKNDPKTRHSLVSAVFAYFTIKRLFPDKPFFPIISFVAIKSHHGNLTKPLNAFFIDEEEILNLQIDAINKELGRELYLFMNIGTTFDKIYKDVKIWKDEFRRVRRFLMHYEKENPKDLYPYFLLNTIFSLLIDADKMEAGVTSFEKIKASLKSELVDRYRDLKGWVNPEAYIDKLRNDVYTKAIFLSEQVKTPSILSLNVPTGLGKTLTAFSLALKLKEKFALSRIIYSLPFLSIIEQNYDVIREVFKKVENALPPDDILLKYHHMSELHYFPSNENEYSPDEEQLLVEGWNSQIVVTTFIQFFHTLIGYKNRMLKKFNKFLNSVIILDEVQSIPFRYWRLMKEILDYLVKEEHCFVIFVTATKPMIVSGDVEIVEDPRLYFSSVNRYRVIPNLKKGKLLDIMPSEIEDSFSYGDSVLVVLNTISAAKTLYNSLRKSDDIKYFYLSTHITPYERLERIKKIKTYKGKKVIISTQLVEAGVDIDLDVVIRDFAPLDSIQQAGGRCNRNGMKERGILKLLNLCDERGKRFSSYIYDPLLLDITAKILPEEEFEEKDFYSIVNRYYKEVKDRLHQEEGVLHSLYVLNYDDGNDAISTFKLIKEEEKIDIFVELNEEAKNVWKRYERVKLIEDRWKRKSAFREFKADFYKYVISVYTQKAMKNLPPEENGMRYIPNSMLEEYYDLETGFIGESHSLIW